MQYTHLGPSGRWRSQLERYEQLCAELGVPPAIVALAWLLHGDGVTAPIIGPRTLDQLHELLPVVDVALDPTAYTRLDEIFPGPGPAPEAWAL